MQSPLSVSFFWLFVGLAAVFCSGIASRQPVKRYRPVFWPIPAIAGTMMIYAAWAMVSSLNHHANGWILGYAVVGYAAWLAGQNHHPQGNQDLVAIFIGLATSVGTFVHLGSHISQ